MSGAGLIHPEWEPSQVLHWTHERRCWQEMPTQIDSARTHIPTRKKCIGVAYKQTHARRQAHITCCQQVSMENIKEACEIGCGMIISNQNNAFRHPEVWRRAGLIRHSREWKASRGYQFWHYSTVVEWSPHASGTDASVGGHTSTRGVPSPSMDTSTHPARRFLKCPSNELRGNNAFRN